MMELLSHLLQKANCVISIRLALVKKLRTALFLKIVINSVFVHV